MSWRPLLPSLTPNWKDKEALGSGWRKMYFLEIWKDQQMLPAVVN